MTTPNKFSLVFIDLTTAATPASHKLSQFCKPLIDALIEGLMGPFAGEYGNVNISLREGSRNDRDPTDIAVNFRDTLPDAPGALADHSVTDGVADIEVGVDLFDGILTGSDPISAGVDHEIKELRCDVGANGWKDRGNGTMDSEETCDFVQNTYIKATNGTLLSNFVLNRFFIPGAKGPWDYLGVMKTQYDVSNGYGITALSPTNIDQIGGERATLAGHKSRIVVVGSLTAKQAKRKCFETSRTMRRGAHPEHVRGLVRG